MSRHAEAETVHYASGRTFLLYLRTGPSRLEQIAGARRRVAHRLRELRRMGLRPALVHRDSHGSKSWEHRGGLVRLVVWEPPSKR